MDGYWILTYMLLALVIGAAYLNIFIARLIAGLVIPITVSNSSLKRSFLTLFIAVLLSIISVILLRRQICFVFETYS